jgi:hypothetical protein
MRLRVPATVALLGLLAGCDANVTPTATRSAAATKTAPCAVGERPDYFVPGPDPDDPHAIIGCARLGASGRPVEFSAAAERIGRQPALCLNPAYRGRGQLGVYIPAHCPGNPVRRRLWVLEMGIPSQAVSGYRLVIWGTAGAGTRHVVARHRSGETAAAVFAVGPGLARAVGAVRPFSVFVVELDVEAACEAILVRGESRVGAETEQVAPRPKLCAR